MSNINNLKRGGITAEEAPKMGSAGGKKSGESRRKKKQLRECLESLLEAKTEFVDDNGKKITGAEALALSAFRKALSGDIKAMEFVRDTSGQKPVEKIATDINPAVVAEIEAIMREDLLDDGSLYDCAIER